MLGLSGLGTAVDAVDLTGRVARLDGPKNENFCRDPKIIANLAGETPAATARIVVNMLSV